MIDRLQSILDWYMQNANYRSVLVCMTIESSIVVNRRNWLFHVSYHSVNT